MIRIYYGILAFIFFCLIMIFDTGIRKHKKLICGIVVFFMVVLAALFV